MMSKQYLKAIAVTVLGLLMANGLCAGEYHVSAEKGAADGDGSKGKPFKTISAAAAVAMPGDTVTVHAGVYREEIDPPRGGESDEKRIVYQAAEGARVVIKGSEPVKGWVRVENDTWKLTLPDSFFGDFNPFKRVIKGDWFSPKGRTHSLGAVYVDGHWLNEARRLSEVLEPQGATPLWWAQHSPAAGSTYLMNLAWLKLGKEKDSVERIPATRHSARRGTKDDGTECVGWIKAGNWLKYEGVDFGARTDVVSLSVSSATQGGRIELRTGSPKGELLGECVVEVTGGWEKWKILEAEIKPTGGKQDLFVVFRPRGERNAGDIDTTTIYAQFKGSDPNEADVEVNARETIFYPRKPGRNYITVRGFSMMHAAPNWAPPTAEQVGLIGTHWSKGWIIEDNEIAYSRCTGITLGKYGDEWDNRSQSADAYNRTIERALENGWNKETIGSHLVRGNHISHCEQAGIVGSMGAAFSEVSNNVIHDINRIGAFAGAEIAGIKFHGPIDTVVKNNHVYRSRRYGIWLDWMTQGARVTGNLAHDNGEQDLFVEVNHGPFVVDNNIFLSGQVFKDWSQGGAYAHNLFHGSFSVRPQGRRTPYHEAHSTEIEGVVNITGGDNRFDNNLLGNPGELRKYDKFKDMTIKDNAGITDVALVEKEDGFYLEFTLPGQARGEPVTTERLGRTRVTKDVFENPDGSPIRIDQDYFGEKRNPDQPAVGPFADAAEGHNSIKVWPRD